MAQRERQNDSWTGERGGSGERSTVRNVLMRMARWPSKSREMSGPGLLPGVRSSSGALEQPQELVLMSEAPVATGRCGGVCGLGCHMRGHLGV